MCSEMYEFDGYSPLKIYVMMLMVIMSFLLPFFFDVYDDAIEY